MNAYVQLLVTLSFFRNGHELGELIYDLILFVRDEKDWFADKTVTVLDGFTVEIMLYEDDTMIRITGNNHNLEFFIDDEEVAMYRNERVFLTLDRCAN